MSHMNGTLYVIKTNVNNVSFQSGKRLYGHVEWENIINAYVCSHYPT